MLGWVFGVTVYAASTVWASFMAGLAIGSLAAGAVGDRVRQPLRWFGVTEILIGATALATPGALAWLQQAYVALYPLLPHALPALTAARLVIALLVLIVPTALMGATLPLVIKGSEARGGTLGGHLGVLYGSNAVGAIVGTIAAGLYLIPGRGIHGTFLTAAALNLAVGVGALVLSSLSPPAVAASSSRIEDPRAEPASSSLTQRQLLISVGVFTLIRRVMNPGGLVLQWVAGTEAEYRAIARTFLSVFPRNDRLGRRRAAGGNTGSRSACAGRSSMRSSGCPDARRACTTSASRPSTSCCRRSSRGRTTSAPMSERGPSSATTVRSSSTFSACRAIAIPICRPSKAT